MYARCFPNLESMVYDMCTVVTKGVICRRPYMEVE